MVKNYIFGRTKYITGTGGSDTISFLPRQVLVVMDYIILLAGSYQNISHPKYKEIRKVYTGM